MTDQTERATGITRIEPHPASCEHSVNHGGDPRIAGPHEARSSLALQGHGNPAEPGGRDSVQPQNKGSRGSLPPGLSRRSPRGVDGRGVGAGLVRAGPNVSPPPINPPDLRKRRGSSVPIMGTRANDPNKPPVLLSGYRRRVHGRPNRFPRRRAHAPSEHPGEDGDGSGRTPESP